MLANYCLVITVFYPPLVSNKVILWVHFFSLSSSVNYSMKCLPSYTICGICLMELLLEIVLMLQIFTSKFIPWNARFGLHLNPKKCKLFWHFIPFYQELKLYPLHHSNFLERECLFFLWSLLVILYHLLL